MALAFFSNYVYQQMESFKEDDSGSSDVYYDYLCYALKKQEKKKIKARQERRKISMENKIYGDGVGLKNNDNLKVKIYHIRN